MRISSNLFDDTRESLETNVYRLVIEFYCKKYVEAPTTTIKIIKNSFNSIHIFKRNLNTYIRLYFSKILLSSKIQTKNFFFSFKNKFISNSTKLFIAKVNYDACKLSSHLYLSFMKNIYHDFKSNPLKFREVNYSDHLCTQSLSESTVIRMKISYAYQLN